VTFRGALPTTSVMTFDALVYEKMLLNKNDLIYKNFFVKEKINEHRPLTTRSVI